MEVKFTASADTTLFFIQRKEALTNANLPEEYRMALAKALQDDLFSKARWHGKGIVPLTDVSPSSFFGSECFSLAMLHLLLSFIRIQLLS